MLRIGGDDHNATVLEMLAGEKAKVIEEQHGEGAAREFAEVALCYSTPYKLHYDE